jgi:hypothetical protein
MGMLSAQLVPVLFLRSKQYWKIHHVPLFVFILTLLFDIYFLKITLDKLFKNSLHDVSFTNCIIISNTYSTIYINQKQPTLTKKKKKKSLGKKQIYFKFFFR